MTDATYKGWSNYETWCVKLWLDNERDTYEMQRNMAAQAVLTAHKRKRRIFTVKELAAQDLAGQLQEWHEENEPKLKPGVYADMLAAAMASVDWYEIALSIFEDNADFIGEDTETESIPA